MGDAWVYALGAPLWIGILIYFVRSTKDWGPIMARWNERRRDAATERAGDWARLRDEVGRLSDRVQTLELKVQACEHDRDEWKSRAITAEAALMGAGKANQEAQRIVSTEREEQAHRRKLK